jgi:hypothetical protein
MKIFIFISTLISALCSLPFIAPPARAASTIPFVGCSASGSQDVPAPSGDPTELNIPANIAAQLALYAGAYEAVIAPRGWNCTGGFGTDAISLSIAPPKGSQYAKDSSITIRSDRAGTRTADYDINTIGRTYFPKLVSAENYKGFVADWNSRGGSVAPVQAPRYSTDRLTYLSQPAFEYETPPNKNGIAQLSNGVASHFAQHGIISIQGKYLPDYNEDDRVVSFINAVLPPDLVYLTPYILVASRPCMLDYDAASCKIHDGITYPDQ